MAILNSENEILTTPRSVEAENVEQARELYWDLVIGHELYADEVGEVIKVNKQVSKRIKTTKDLNDFYAYCERNMDEDEICNLSYEFYETEAKRIDDLLDDIDYTQGIYDKKNIKRILGGTKL